MTTPDHITETIARAGNFGGPIRYRNAAAEHIINVLTEAGYAIVPVEPTPRMLRDGCESIEGSGVFPRDLETDKYPFESNWKAEAWCCYRAMIAAAPDHIMPPIPEPGPLEAEEGE